MKRFSCYLKMYPVRCGWYVDFNNPRDLRVKQVLLDHMLTHSNEEIFWTLEYYFRAITGTQIKVQEEKFERNEYMDFVLSLPWITKLRDSVRCAGIKWDNVPNYIIKDLKTLPPSSLDPYRCKNKATWKLDALSIGNGLGDAISGIYCFLHLKQQMKLPSEARRLREYQEKLEAITNR